ncbi:MAG: hypothetical protein ABSD71_10985 [Bacteroidales bacterium]|jgi:hypothetical protein
MEKEDFLTDDFLTDLFRSQPVETLGDDFTSDIMEQILKAPEIAAVRKPFYLILKSSWPYILLFLVTLVFMMTSDLPFSDYIPGKEFMIKNFLPAIKSMFSGFKPLIIDSKFIMIPAIVILAGSLLIGLDHFLFRKPDIRHQTTR